MSPCVKEVLILSIVSFFIITTGCSKSEVSDSKKSKVTKEAVALEDDTVDVFEEFYQKDQKAVVKEVKKDSPTSKTKSGKDEINNAFASLSDITKDEPVKKEPILKKRTVPIKAPIVTKKTALTNKKRSTTTKRDVFSAIDDIVPHKNGVYTVQFASVQSQGLAEEKAKMFKREGLPVYIHHCVNPTPQNQGDYYRIRVGYFNNRADAVAFGEYYKVKKQWGFWVDKKSSEESQDILSTKTKKRTTTPIVNKKVTPKPVVQKKVTPKPVVNRKTTSSQNNPLIVETAKVEQPKVKKVENVAQSQKKPVQTAVKPPVSILEKVVTPSKKEKKTIPLSGSLADEWGDDGDGWASDTTDW